MVAGAGLVIMVTRFLLFVTVLRVTMVTSGVIMVTNTGVISSGVVRFYFYLLLQNVVLRKRLR